MPDQLIYINSHSGLQLYRLVLKIKRWKHLIPVLGQGLKNHQTKLQNAVRTADISSEIAEKKYFKEVWVLCPIGDYNSGLKDLIKLERLGLSLKIVPDLNEWKNLDLHKIISTNFSTHTIIKYQSYEPSKSAYYLDKTVLITGAGGSIGGVLAILANQEPCKKLVLIDHSESAIHQLKSKLNLAINTTDIHFLVADIRDKSRLYFIFREHRPDVIFHLAAYKHVGLMEGNGSEAFKVNVLGTRNLFELSKEYQIRQFNFISTDKAVNPVCVMGLTKKIAEDYLLNTPDSEVKINILRFGNVLGSSGSVVETFKRAVDNSRLLEIKDRRMRRYFILDEDAAKFIWHAPLEAKNKDTFVFYIKESTAIKDLAKSMLVLNGILDINGQITELQSDTTFEKLTEQLFDEDQVLLNTSNEQVKIIPKPVSDSTVLEKIINLTPQLDSDKSELSFLKLKAFFSDKTPANN